MAEGRPGLKEILKRVLENIELVRQLAYTRSLEKTLELAEELEKRIGIRVFISENTEKQYPALIVNTTPEFRGTLAWIDINKAESIRIYEDVDGIMIEPKMYINLLRR